MRSLFIARALMTDIHQALLLLMTNKMSIRRNGLANAESCLTDCKFCRQECVVLEDCDITHIQSANIAQASIPPPSTYR